jgi:hypothetical protein
MNGIVSLRNFVQLAYKTPSNTYYFVGKDEAEANHELNKWMKWSVNRSGELEINRTPLKANGFSKDHFHTVNPVILHSGYEGLDKKLQELNGKGHSLIGKVWMINHKDHLRARVNPSEVSAYEAEGFERGGPKTAFRG